MVKINKMQTLMKENNINQVVITSPNNIFYLCGYAPNQLSVSLNNNIAVLYINLEKAVIITMDYESEFIKKQVSPEIEVLSYTTWTGIGSEEEYKIERDVDTSITLIEILKRIMSNEIIGLELNSISHQFIQNFDNYTDISNMLLSMRKIKTNEEIEIFRKLCKIQSLALKKMAHSICEGISENELIKVYRNEIFKSNYCVPSAWTMLCSGVNSAYLSTPTSRKIEKNDMIKFDGGVNLEFSYYTTDMSRSFVVGENKLLKEVKDVLVNAQRLMIENVKPGIKCSELFNIGYNYVKAIYPGYVRGHLGHSISFGPSTFEPPFISINDNTVLEAGMIFCIEVPMYIKDIGGMNIEDMVLVTEDGYEVLTNYVDHYEYELIKEK